MASVPGTSDATLPLRCGGVCSGICDCNAVAPLNLRIIEMTDAPLDIRLPSTQMGYVHVAGAWTVLNNVYYHVLETVTSLAVAAERLSDDTL